MFGEYWFGAPDQPFWNTHTAYAYHYSSGPGPLPVWMPFVKLPVPGLVSCYWLPDLVYWAVITVVNSGKQTESTIIAHFHEVPDIVL